jgi:membrane fusion protein (multidrug efflux system)
MDRNDHSDNAESAWSQFGPNLNGSQPKATSLLQTDGHEQLDVEMRSPRLEVEHLRDQHQALQRDPHPNHSELRNDADRSPGHDLDGKDLTDGSHLRRWRLRLVFALALTALLCVAGLRFWNYTQSYEWTDDAEIRGHLDPLSTRINDTVIHVDVENTYHVQKGQVLVDLDPRDYQASLENAVANLAEAEQGVEAAQQSYNLSIANLAAAEATNAKAQLDVQRFGELYRQNVIPLELYDEIFTTGKVDVAAVASDRAAVTAMARMIGQAKAAELAAQASLDQAKLNLSYTHILAPAAGVVGDKTVQVGQRVEPGEQLLTIVPVNDIWITADFRETQLRRMHRGQLVTVHVDTTGRDYKGYIEGLPGASGELYSLLPPENATGNYVKVVQRLPVRIRLNPGEDQDHRLRPGMSVEPTVWVQGGPRSLW